MPLLILRLGAVFEPIIARVCPGSRDQNVVEKQVVPALGVGQGGSFARAPGTMVHLVAAPHCQDS